MNTTFASRNVGKSVINDEADDDDGLLKESFGYASGGPPVPANHAPRRATNPNLATMPVSRFASLSLNTSRVHNMSPPPVSNFTSPRPGSTMQSPGAPLSAMSPHTLPSTLSSAHNPAYPPYPQHFTRPTYPPVNPADQNPPCNTLYVGNLPMDTSEDELKAVFSKQRGYKRLCFRTKQNGPMCFVEFEDTSFATKALNELYGYMLHNSVKGGIRLSFSKNPLGVRSGQGATLGPPSSMASSTPCPPLAPPWPPLPVSRPRPDPRLAFRRPQASRPLRTPTVVLASACIRMEASAWPRMTWPALCVSPWRQTCLAVASEAWEAPTLLT